MQHTKKPFGKRRVFTVLDVATRFSGGTDHTTIVYTQLIALTCASNYAEHE